MDKQEKKLREQLHNVVSSMEDILEKAEREGRELSNKEQNKFDDLNAKAKNARNKLQKKGVGISDSGRAEDPDTFTPFENGNSQLSNKQMNRQATPINGSEKISTQNSPSNQKWVDPNTGKEVRVLGANERLASPNDGFDDFDMSRAIRALATGDYSGAQAEVKAMDLSGTAAMVPTPVSQRLIDRARDQMVLNALGMQTVPMSSSSLTFARVDSDGDPSPEWKSENASFTDSDVGISGVELNAKTIICGVTLSHELAADSPNASQVVEDTIAKAIAQEVDRAGLLGSGSDPEPQGIFGHSGVTDTALDATPTYDDFSDLYHRLTTNNEQPNGLVTSSRTMKTLDQIKDNEGRYLAPPQSWDQFMKLTTNAIPNDQGTGNNESLAIMGNYMQLFQGVRENLQIEVSREASDGSSNAWSDLQVKIRVFMRVDYALGRPGAFQTLSGILS